MDSQSIVNTVHQRIYIYCTDILFNSHFEEEKLYCTLEFCAVGEKNVIKTR